MVTLSAQPCDTLPGSWQQIHIKPANYITLEAPNLSCQQTSHRLNLLQSCKSLYTNKILRLIKRFYSFSTCISVVWQQRENYSFHQTEVKRSRECCVGMTPSTQTNRQQKNDITWIISTDKPSQRQKQFICKPELLLGVKPQNKSLPWQTGGRVLARAWRSGVSDANVWPEQPSWENSSSTPQLSRAHSCGSVSSNTKN